MFHTLLVPVEFAADGVNSTYRIAASFVVAGWGVSWKAAVTGAVITALGGITEFKSFFCTGSVPDV